MDPVRLPERGWRDVQGRGHRVGLPGLAGEGVRQGAGPAGPEG